MRKEKVSRRMGSLTGSNQMGRSARSLWKKVDEMTATASPKKLPNMNPQKVVDSPHQKNILTILPMPGSMFLYLRITTAQAIVMTRP